MNKLSLFALTLGAAALCSCSDKAPKGIEHVLLISIDGITPQALVQADTPVIDSLMRNGAYSLNVRSTIPTNTGENWYSMMSGAGPEATCVIDSHWGRNTNIYPPVVMTENHCFPNILTLLREQRPSSVLAGVAEWNGAFNFFETELLDVKIYDSTEVSGGLAMADCIRKHKPTAMFVQLNKTDHKGHAIGYMTPSYLQTLHENDADVGLAMNALREEGLADKTLVIVTAAHGGLGHGHGQYSYEEFTTPIIYSGPGVKKGYEIQQQIYKYDVAADVAFAFGLKMPQQWTARPVKCIYKGISEPENIYVGRKMLPSPYFVNEDVSMYGDLVIDKDANVVIEKRMPCEGEIHYTLDGSVPTEESPLYEGPFTLAKAGYVKAKIFASDGGSMVASAYYRIARASEGNGLRYSYYCLPGAEGLPAFDRLKPLTQGLCHELTFKGARDGERFDNLSFPDFNSLLDMHDSDFGLRIEGFIEIDHEDDYTFRTWERGAIRLTIDGQVIFERLLKNKESFGEACLGTISLKPGRYPIRLDFFSGGDRPYVDLFYETKHDPRMMIPADKLFLSSL